MAVALLAEGVDRNKGGGALLTDTLVSPSSRRAWIEIDLVCSPDVADTVALLAEGVDRNRISASSSVSPSSRPPRGGRG